MVQVADQIGAVDVGVRLGILAQHLAGQRSVNLVVLCFGAAHINIMDVGGALIHDERDGIQRADCEIPLALRRFAQGGGRIIQHFLVLGASQDTAC